MFRYYDSHIVHSETDRYIPHWLFKRMTGYTDSQTDKLRNHEEFKYCIRKNMFLNPKGCGIKAHGWPNPKVFNFKKGYLESIVGPKQHTQKKETKMMHKSYRVEPKFNIGRDVEGLVSNKFRQKYSLTEKEFDNAKNKHLVEVVKIHHAKSYEWAIVEGKNLDSIRKRKSHMSNELYAKDLVYQCDAKGIDPKEIIFEMTKIVILRENN